MELKTFIKAMSQYKKIFWLTISVIFLLGMTITLLQPLKYGSSSSLLIVQNYGSMTDPYTVSRSNQYLSNLLATVVTSQSFYNETMSVNANIDRSYFPTDTDKQMKLWQKTVEAKSLGDSGVIEISVYHTNRYQTQQIAKAVNYALITKNYLYRGNGNDLNIKILDEPVVSIWPVRPNILVNILIFITLGFFAGIAQVYARATGVIKTNPIQQNIENINAPAKPVMSMPNFETINTVVQQPEPITAPMIEAVVNVGATEKAVEVKTETTEIKKVIHSGDISNLF